MSSTPPLTVPVLTPLDDPLISVVVPVLDEQATIAGVLARVLALDLRLELLVVDDGSTDDSAATVRAMASADDRIRLLQHPRNRGKGAAIRTGFAASTGAIVTIQDADLEYDPNELLDLVRPIVEGHADAVYGTRLRGGRVQRAHMFRHYVGNRILSLLTRILFNTTISDVEVGAKAFRGPLARGFPLESNDFRFEIEITARLLRTPNVRVYETPVSYFGRSVAEGKKISWRDGLLALLALARYARVRSQPYDPTALSDGEVSDPRSTPDAVHVPSRPR